MAAAETLTGLHSGIGETLFSSTQEIAKPELSPSLGLMTRDEINTLLGVFQSLPGHTNEEGAEVITLESLGNVTRVHGASIDREAELIITNPGAKTRAERRKKSAGPAVFRGIKRNSEEGKWMASFTLGDLPDTQMFESGKFELRSLHDQEPIGGNFEGKHIISLAQFAREDLEAVFRLTPYMRELCMRGVPSKILAGLIVATTFFKESSRTRASSEAAIQQLGGSVVSILDPKFSSMAKGESLEHTLQTFEAYTDAIIMRHDEEGSVTQAGKWLKRVPIINAGDGNGEHPTQAILDLNTILEEVGRLDHLNGVIAGDLLHGRTVHSLVQGLALYPGNSITFLSNDLLRLPEEYRKRIEEKGVAIREIERIEDMPQNADFWYWTRSQTERFTPEEKAHLGEDWEKQFVVSQDVLDKYAGPDTILMHPLPINSNNPEILREVQDDPRSIYLESEIRNGLYTRMTLLALVTGRLKLDQLLKQGGPNIF